VATLKQWLRKRRIKKQSPKMGSLKVGPVSRDKTYAEKLRAAFPREQRAGIDAVISILVNDRPRSYYLDDKIATLPALNLSGSVVRIPYRIYLPEPDGGLVETLTPDQRVFLSCIYTRHFDGYIRERHLRWLLENTVDPVIVPFVVQLMGEYVSEICEVVANWPSDIPIANYLAFAEENPAFITLTCQHAMSYWAVFYGRRYRFFEMPPLLAMSRLGIWDHRIGKRKLRRGGPANARVD
jgi:hypothetical protein